MSYKRKGFLLGRYFAVNMRHLDFTKLRSCFCWRWRGQGCWPTRIIKPLLGRILTCLYDQHRKIFEELNKRQRCQLPWGPPVIDHMFNQPDMLMIWSVLMFMSIINPPGHSPPELHTQCPSPSTFRSPLSLMFAAPAFWWKARPGSCLQWSRPSSQPRWSTALPWLPNAPASCCYLSHDQNYFWIWIRNIENSPHEHFHRWRPLTPVPTMPAVKLSSDQERTRRLQQQKRQRQQ